MAAGRRPWHNAGMPQCTPPQRFREFIAPLPLIAVGVLLLNDHLLKATFHNTVTGKLSDLAGCFFLPLYVSALLSAVTPSRARLRLLAGVGITCAIFIPVSVSRFAADTLCAFLAPIGALIGLTGYRIAADPTDLLALPMVAAAYFFGCRRLNRSEEFRHEAA